MKMAGRKVWRDAATLILTARSGPAAAQQSSSSSSPPSAYSDHFDYRVLMVKRSSKSKFMPNAYVFPGGVVAEADSSGGWLEVFREQGVTRDDLEELVLDGAKVDRPLLMRAEVNEAVARDIGLRIAAIRETFEETGVLLHRGPGGERGAYSWPAGPGLAEWRAKVHSCPDQLLQLCRQLGVLPDLWALAEWADWLTPTDLHEQGRRRFDTIFYQASLATQPATLLDQAEVTAARWTDPASILQQFHAEQLWLAPPQVYELGKLLRFSCARDLAAAAHARQQHGLVTWLPVRVECEDGLVSLLPGDCLYPAHPDYGGLEPGAEAEGEKTIQIKHPGTVQSTRPDASAPLNRLEFRGMFDCVPRANYVSQHQHIKPMAFSDFQEIHQPCDFPFLV